MSEEIKNIVFLGAPSTGKTSLAEKLASHFNTLFMPEYGKIYWKEHQVDRRLTMDQLQEIAEGHLQLEDEMLQQAKKYLFTDTNAITTYMFALDYFGEASESLSSIAKSVEDRYDLYFLCDTDIPYEESWERSGEMHREKFQQMIIEDLKDRRIEFTVLSGDLENRFKTVLKMLD